MNMERWHHFSVVAISHPRLQTHTGWLHWDSSKGHESMLSIIFFVPALFSHRLFVFITALTASQMPYSLCFCRLRGGGGGYNVKPQTKSVFHWEGEKCKMWKRSSTFNSFLNSALLRCDTPPLPSSPPPRTDLGFDGSCFTRYFSITKVITTLTSWTPVLGCLLSLWYCILLARSSNWSKNDKGNDSLHASISLQHFYSHVWYLCISWLVYGFPVFYHGYLQQGHAIFTCMCVFLQSL